LTLQAPTGSDGGPQSITISVDDANAASIAASQALLSDHGLSTGTTSGTNAKTTRADLQKDLDGIMEQINQLAADASYNGVNLLDGDTLKVQFNEDNSSKLDITSNTTDAAGLKIDSLSLAEDADIERAISSL
jgi:flagellin